MDKTSQQRKITYLIGIVVLLIPIFLLGMPSDGKENGAAGLLSNLRKSSGLGESDVGQVDPSSAAMNLVLLGMRGVAANVMWQEMDEQKNRKDWPSMERTTDAIIRLQPHFVQVWRFNGWNLAFNVSVEWDDVADRFHWVKKGGKFLRRGTDMNKRIPDIPWELGRVCGFKIGMSDEAAFFRRYFRDADPDPVFKNRPDPEMNPNAEDNYLVAKEWYSLANDREKSKRQHITDKMIFRSYPMRSQFDYAAALQREGRFGDVTRLGWEKGFDEWTGIYGQERYSIPKEFFSLPIFFEMGYLTNEELLAEIKDESLMNDCKRWVDSYQKMVNYRYWRLRGMAEKEPNMAEARQLFHEALKLFNESKFTTWKDETGKSQDGVRQLLDKSLQLFEDVLSKKVEDKDGKKRLMYADLIEMEEDVGETALMAVLLWQDCLELSPKDGRPTKFALQEFFSTRTEFQLTGARQLLKRTLSDMNKIQKMERDAANR